MNDSKITKKYYPSGSLSRRILSVAIFLLVVPLFLQSLFLYRQEYEQKLEDVGADLKLLASERAHLIEEAVQTDWQLLERERGNRDERDLNQLGIQRIPLPQQVAKRFLLVSKNRNALLAGVVESNTSALVISIPLEVIARDMPRAYPVRISLVNDRGNVLWENRKWEEGEEIVEASDPIGGSGLSIELGVEKSHIQGLHLSSYYFRFATLLFFVGIIGGTGVYFFTRRIGRPLKNLCKTMERVAEGAVHARYTSDWMGFEVNDLGLQFNQTLDALLHNEQEAQKERLMRERLAGELRIGHEIQESLVPRHVSGGAGLDTAAGYLAAKEVNGDFYDLFPMENGHLMIAVCDTAGKGISACLFSLGLRSILRSLANVTPDLSELVRRANDLYLLDAHETSMFSTVWVGIYDPHEHKLTYCSQGHPPALLIRKGAIEEIWTPGIALGAQKVDVIPTNKLFLEKGDSLILYTDGILEAHDPENRLFGKDRLYDLLRIERGETAEQLKDRILDQVHIFSRGAPQHDDMTLLVVRVSN